MDYKKREILIVNYLTIRIFSKSGRRAQTRDPQLGRLMSFNPAD